MKKNIQLIFLLFIISLTAGGAIFFSGWLQMGNTLQRTSDGYKYRTSLGSPGFAYWYQLYQVDSIAALKQNLITTGTNLLYFRGDLSLATFPTNLSSFTNGPGFISLSSLSAVTPLSYNPSVGIFSISQATTSTNGWLPSTDWNTFNNKQPLITTGTNLQYFDGLFGLHTFPTNLSAFTNGPNYATVSQILANRNAANFGLTATLSDVAHLPTPLSGDQTVEVGGCLNLLTVTGTDSVSVKVTWTDNHSVSKTKIFPAIGVRAGSQIGVVDDYPLATMSFRALNGTQPQISAVVTGTGTILYEVMGWVKTIKGDGGL